MIIYARYKGLKQGRHAYDIMVRVPDVPEGLGIVRDVTTVDLMSGKEFEADFSAFNGKNYTFPKPGPTKKAVRASVTRQERKRAEELGGRRQTGSGARPHAKGDGRVEGRFRIENKMTRAASTRIELKDLKKIRSECEGTEVPVFEVEFRDKQTLETKEKWALVPWEVWRRIADEADNDR